MLEQDSEKLTFKNSYIRVLILFLVNITLETGASRVAEKSDK